MSLLFSLLMKMDAGQAKTELRSLQGELTKTGTGAKVLGTDAKGASVGVDVLGDQSAAAATQLRLLAESEKKAALDAALMARANAVATAQTATGMNRVQSGSLLAGNGARLFSQQLSQVGQQTMATGQFVQALAIQLPDIGIGFGAVGGAVGLLAGIALPLVVSWFGNTADKASELETVLESLRQSMTTLRSASSDLGQGLSEQVNQYGMMVFAAREVLAVQQRIAEARAQMALVASQTAISSLFGDVKDAVNMENTVAAATNRLYALGEIAAAIGVEFNEVTPEIVAVATALDLVANAKGPEQSAAAMASLRDAIISATDNGKELNDAAIDVLQSLTDAELAALELSRTDIASAISAGIGPASQLASLLAQAASSFGSLPSANGFLRKVSAGANAVGAWFSGLDDTALAPTTSSRPKRAPALIGESGNATGGGGRGGGGASAARAEKDAVAELIAKLREEQEVLRETDPVKLEMMKHRKALADATAAERAEVENLIRAEQQLKAVRAAEDFASQSAADFLDAIIVRGESAEDALKSLLSSLIKVGIQALMLGQGPLAGLLGISGGIFSGALSGGARLPFMAVGGYVQALATGGDATPRLAADARRMPARDASQMRRLTAGDALRFATAARQAPVNGLVTGEGGPRDDKVATWLSAGEYVVNGRATAQYRPLLERINAGSGVQGYAAGGMIGAARPGGGASGGFGGSARGDTHIHIHGAMGNSEIYEMVKTGVEAGIEANNTHVLPDRVLGILSDPRVR